MRITIASDHAGYKLKEGIKKYLINKHFKVLDLGTFSEESVDYPGYAKKAAKVVASGEAEKAILVCGSGVGMSMAANKIRNIRAASCESLYTAKMSRMHNDSNVLCLGSRILSKAKALNIVEIWLRTDFEGGRHLRRVKKIG